MNNTLQLEQVPEVIVGLAARLSAAYRPDGWQAEEAARDAVIDAWLAGQRPRVIQATHAYYRRIAFRGALRGCRKMRSRYGLAVPVWRAVAEQIAAYDPTPLQALTAREEQEMARVEAVEAIQRFLDDHGIHVSLEDISQIARLREALVEDFHIRWGLRLPVRLDQRFISEEIYRAAIDKAVQAAA